MKPRMTDDFKKIVELLYQDEGIGGDELLFFCFNKSVGYKFGVVKQSCYILYGIQQCYFFLCSVVNVFLIILSLSCD